MKFNLWKNKHNQPETGPWQGMLGSLFQGRHLGTPLRRGPLEMVPVFGSPVQHGTFAPPETSIVMKRVVTYGQMVLANQATKPTIVPLHIGYMQKGAQNHAMTTAGILAAGEEKTWTDACCIQAAQGGYITEMEARFIMLPHALRAAALRMRGMQGAGKLWDHISRFNASLGMKARGHLDELKQDYQPELLKTVYFLEPQPGQTGALFFCNGQLIGIELAPDAAFWAEMHVPLVMYVYAPLRLLPEFSGYVNEGPAHWAETPDVLALIREIEATAQARAQAAHTRATQAFALPLTVERKEVQMHDRLTDVRAGEYAGQAVYHETAPAYASVFHQTAWNLSQS